MRRYRVFFLSLIAIFMVGPWSALATATTLRVYRADDTLQCGTGHEITLDQMRAEIEKAGVKVISQEKRQLPAATATAAVCGAPTGNVNTYEIADSDWRKLQKQASDRFEMWVFDKPTTEVFKYDGTLQCETGKGISLDDMGAELTKAEIAVSARRKDSDGLMRIQQCGSATGSVNVFEIPSDSFGAARKLGFEYFAASP